MKMKERIHSGKVTINFLNLNNKICNILQQYSLRGTKYLRKEIGIITVRYYYKLRRKGREVTT